MSQEKKPLTDAEFDKILQAAIRKDAEGAGKQYPCRGGLEGRVVGETEAIVLFLRYTGMHVSILAEADHYDLHLEDDMIVWNRTKKQGKMARTSIPIHKNIIFDIMVFIEDMKKRKRRISRQFFHAIIKGIGERAGVPGISPMTFRHTLAVSMLNEGFQETLILQTLNCSRKVLATYGQYTDPLKKSAFQKLGWCN